MKLSLTFQSLLVVSAIASPIITSTIPSSSVANTILRRPDDNRYSLPVTRQGSSLYVNGERWTASGVNVYWLGLDENVIPPKGEPVYPPTNASYPTKGRITEAFKMLNAMGARTVRSQTLGISVGNPLSVMPKLGRWNEKAFDTMDWSIYQAGQHDIKVFAPLVDNYDYYHGGKFSFLRFRGIHVDANNLTAKVQQFYTDRAVIDDFKMYIKKILSHRNKYTGLTYAEDPTIFAYETGNELGGPVFGDMDVPVDWTTEITAFIKHLAPTKLTIDGTYGINTSHLSIPWVDIYSDHFYPRNLTKLSNGISQVGRANKVYFAAEYQWIPNVKTGDTLAAFHEDIEKRQKTQKPVIAGSHVWSLFGHNVPNCRVFVDHPSDANTLQYGNPAYNASFTEAVGEVRRHLFAMQGISAKPVVRPVSCP